MRNAHRAHCGMNSRVLRAACTGSSTSHAIGPRGRLLVRMQLQVTRWDAKSQGPVTRQKVLAKLKEEGFSAIVYQFPPGTSFGNHTHPCDKKDTIVSGQFLFKTNGEEVMLQPGDMLLVPRGCVHSAEVLGTEPCEFIDATRLD